jgi:hypothetical protein
MIVREWEGTAWQDFCVELLRMRYANHNLVEVPDRHNGDLGLEAFTHDGVAFQCYAAKEPLSTNSLYEHQRDKLTTDLGKLQKNKLKLSRLLNGVEVHRYVFLVHRHDSKELVIHAQTKASEVRAWGLPFIRDDFAITVETDDHYAQERNRMTSIPSQLVEATPADEQVLTEWGDENADMLEDARRKLVNIGIRGAGLDNYLVQLSGMFLRGENGLAKESMLSLEYPPGSTNNGTDVTRIVKDVAAEIVRDSGGVPPNLANTLAWSMVADWILRCPLDFQEPA